MRTKLFFLLFIFIAVGLLFQSACKTADAWEFNIQGTWNFNVVSTWASDFSDTLTFSGSTSSGTVTGGIWDYHGKIGTYTVSGTAVSINYTFLCLCGADVTWTFNATASENNENSLSGTGSYTHAPSTWSFTWTATR